MEQQGDRHSRGQESVKERLSEGGDRELERFGVNQEQ
jgi:hypothetical protein